MINEGQLEYRQTLIVDNILQILQILHKFHFVFVNITVTNCIVIHHINF